MKFPIPQPRSLIGRIVFWGMLAFVVLLAGGFLWVRAWLGSYLESEAFRQWLGGMTSRQLQAKCEYEPFHFSGLTVRADGFKAQGTEKAAFSTLELEKIRTGLNLQGLWNKTLQIDDVTIDRFQISLGHTGAPPVPESEIGAIPEKQNSTSSSPSWLSPKLDLRQVVVKEATLLWGEKTPQEGSVAKTEITVKPDGDAWNIGLKGGTVSQHGQPPLDLDHLDVHFQSPIADIPDGLLKFPAGGDIGITGQVNTEKSLEVHVKVNRVSVTPFLPPSVQSRLRGNAFAEIKVSGPMPVEDGLVISGQSHLENAEITQVPILDLIGKIIHSPQFANVKLDTASADFTYANEKVTVTNLVVEKKGFLCIKGRFVVYNSQIDGHFQLGIAHNLLIPILESMIFTHDEGGYRWAPMNVTGPLSSPSNDLVQHIISNPQLLSLAGSAVGDIIKNAPKIEDSTKKVIQGAQGLFNQLHK